MQKKTIHSKTTQSNKLCDCFV